MRNSAENQIFWNSGSLFGRMQKRLVKQSLFYRFLGPFSLKIHFWPKKWKFLPKTVILAKFLKFHKIWWNSPNFTHFGVLGPPKAKKKCHALPFKAEKVTLWEVSRLCAEKVIFASENDFLVIFPFWGGISNFFGPERTFSARGLQKTSQELMFIKVFWPGCPRADSGPKKSLLGSQHAKNGEIPPILGKRGVLLEKAPCYLKNNQ